MHMCNEPATLAPWEAADPAAGDGLSPPRETWGDTADTPCGGGSPMREKCGAIPKGGGPPCQNPVGTCRLHCGAALRGERVGRYCPMPPCRGGTRCRMHSGKAVKGVAHPAYRTGRYSKHMPKEVRKISKEAYADDELLSLREQLAMLEVR